MSTPQDQELGRPDRIFTSEQFHELINSLSTVVMSLDALQVSEAQQPFLEMLRRHGANMTRILTAEGTH